MDKNEITLKQLSLLKEIIAFTKRKPCKTVQCSMRVLANFVSLAKQIQELNNPPPKGFAKGGYVTGKNDKLFIDEAESIINIKPNNDE